MKKYIQLIAMLSIVFSLPNCSRIRAQEVGRIATNEAIGILRVAVDPNPPFAMLSNDEWIGYDIDLCKAIADDNDWSLQFVGKTNVGDIVEAITSGEVDIGAAGITINLDRQKQIDFSQPYFNSGLQLLMMKNVTKVPLSEKWTVAFPVFLGALKILFIILTVFAHAIWIIERFNGDDVNFSKNYWRGIGQAYWWALVTATTVGYGDITPKKLVGRIVAGFVMVIGIMWFGGFSGQMGAVQAILTQDSQGVNISTMNSDNKIGTKEFSTAHKYLRNKPWALDSMAIYNNITVACEDVERGIIDGVFFDYPALKRFADGSDKVMLVGDIVQKEQYGIAMQTKSIYREAIDLSLQCMKEDGRLEFIHKKWFKE